MLGTRSKYSAILPEIRWNAGEGADLPHRQSSSRGSGADGAIRASSNSSELGGVWLTWAGHKRMRSCRPSVPHCRSHGCDPFSPSSNRHMSCSRPP